MLLLLHDQRYDDYFSRLLIEQRDQLNEPLEVLSVDELLTGCSYEYNQDGRIKVIRYKGKRIITENTLLINRLIRLSASNFEIGQVHPKAYFKYCTSFLSNLIGRFGKATNFVGESCLSGPYYPLNMQWHLIKKHLSGIETPQFDFSFGYQLNDISFENAVVANPNDFNALLNPSPEENTVPAMHTFRFARQVGKPFVCYFSGEYFNVESLDLGGIEKLSERDFGLLGQIKTLFGIFAGEIVFFKEHETFVFGSISHYYDQARSFSEAGTIAVNGINDFFTLTRMEKAV